MASVAQEDRSGRSYRVQRADGARTSHGAGSGYHVRRTYGCIHLQELHLVHQNLQKVLKTDKHGQKRPIYHFFIHVYLYQLFTIYLYN